jgi:hypothetical protein
MPAIRATRSTLRRPTTSRTRVAATPSERRIIGPSRSRSAPDSRRSPFILRKATSSMTLKTLAAGAVWATWKPLSRPRSSITANATSPSRLLA